MTHIALDKSKAIPHNCVCGALRIFSATNLSRILEIHRVFLRILAFFVTQNLSQIALAELCGIALKIPVLPLFDAGVSPSKGIYPDYLKMISEDSGLNFEILEAKSDKELGEMLWTGKADVAFVIYAEGTYYSTVYFTNEVDQELFVAIISRNKEKIPEPATVGLIQTFNGMQSHWKKYKPIWAQKYYDTVEDCLNALERDECDVAFVPARILQRESSLATHPSLKTDDANNVQLSICLAISPHQPQMLQNVLNTAILHLDKGYVAGVWQ